MKTLFVKLTEIIEKSEKITWDSDGGSLYYGIYLGDPIIENVILFPNISSENKVKLEEIKDCIINEGKKEELQEYKSFLNNLEYFNVQNTQNSEITLRTSF